MSDHRPDDEPTPSSEPELSGPIGWLFGLINSFLMLGVKLGIALVQGIFGAFLGGGRDRTGDNKGDNTGDNTGDNSEPPAPS